MTTPHYYLALSVLSTFLFGCTVLNFGPFGELTTMQATGMVIVLFTALTVTQSLRGS